LEGGISRKATHLRGRNLERQKESAQKYGKERYRRGLILVEEADRSARGDGVLSMEALILALTQ
jgi:hypothetical protein